VQTETAGILAEWLADHPRISAVHYPGLPDHPGHEVAASQMTGFGAMLSIRTGLSGEETLERTGRANVFTRATSLGGTESLIEHRKSVEGDDSRTPADLIRLSIGLEHVDDLREDLDRILA
jgi:cystathionine gamma-synthase